MADNKTRILIVGRDSHDSKRLAHDLKNCDYHVDMAGDQHAAMESANKGGVDVIITDHDHESVDAMELARLLKQANNAIKVVMRSSPLDLETYLEAMNLGCDDCVEKSVNNEEMLRVVDALRRRIESQSSVN